MPMKTEAVIFDLDNTLINRKLAFRAYSEHFIDRFASVRDARQKEEFVEFMRVSDRDGYRDKREMALECLASFPLKNPETTAEELLDHWFAEFYNYTVLMDGTLDVLERLKRKDIKLGLITNGSPHAQHAKIDKAQIREYFDVVIVSGEAGFHKPDKRLFELALSRLEAKPENSWYVGDHPRNDVFGATSAGLKAVWLRGFMDWHRDLDEPEHRIDSLDEIIALIDKA
ncbi:HAD family hydrolase [Paenibacillus sp. FSL M7-1455]|uniref:HAD family hydrolase n=1 Tax=Paenibacillus sp. FSL M7-1455 TaxID=2975316 RepID=UPI0030F5A242